MRSRHILWRIVLISLLFYSAFSLFSEAEKLDRTAREADLMASELQALKAENIMLSNDLEQSSQTQLQQLARERLGLVLPGEKIFYFKHRED